MVVASEGTGGRCFDGLVDDVRISSGIVTENNRLYNLGIGSFGFLPADTNMDGYVNLVDLANVAYGWMKCTNPNDIINCQSAF
jgi:hypothetical protein